LLEIRVLKTSYRIIDIERKGGVPYYVVENPEKLSSISYKEVESIDNNATWQLVK